MEFRLDKFDLNPVLEPRRGCSWDAAQVRNPAAIMHEGKVHIIYTAAGDMDISKNNN